MNFDILCVVMLMYIPGKKKTSTKSKPPKSLETNLAQMSTFTTA